MHDGSIATLSQVLDTYAQGGQFPHAAGESSLLVGFSLTPSEMADVLAFLESLADESFTTDPAHQDPWPPGDPAVARRAMP